MDLNLYELDFSESNVTFKEILSTHKKELSMEIVKKICYAIYNDIKQIDIASIKTSTDYIVLKATEPRFLETLELNKQVLIDFEEYELCSEIIKATEYFNKKNPVNFLDYVP